MTRHNSLSHLATVAKNDIFSSKQTILKNMTYICNETNTIKQTYMSKYSMNWSDPH